MARKRQREGETVTVVLPCWQWERIAHACEVRRDSVSADSIRRRTRGKFVEAMVEITAPPGRLATLAQHALNAIPSKVETDAEVWERIADAASGRALTVALATLTMARRAG